ncbi:MAG: hypothetical protein DMD82_01220, partial [Candidatus Rokuibacteriota bacterium]
MAHILRGRGTPARLYGLDSFEGLPEPSPEDAFEDGTMHPWVRKGALNEASFEELEQTLLRGYWGSTRSGRHWGRRRECAPRGSQTPADALPPPPLTFGATLPATPASGPPCAISARCAFKRGGSGERRIEAPLGRAVRPGQPRRAVMLKRSLWWALLLLALVSVSIPFGEDAALRAAPSDGVWSQVPYPAPTARKWAGVILDPLRDRMLVIAGYPGPQGDVWVQPFSGPSLWSRLLPAGAAPSARFAHSVIYQPTQDRVILFGGFDTAFRNDVWALSLSGTPTWSQLTPAGPPPPARWAHVAIYDAARDRMIVFGGYDGSAS